MRKPLPTFQYQRAKAANYLTELELCRDREIQYNLKNRYGTSQKNIPCTPQRDGTVPEVGDVFRVRSLEMLIIVDI